MAAKVYPQNVTLGAVLERKECGSDIEDGENDRELPVRWVPDWRAEDLMTVLHHFDTMVIAQAVHHKAQSVNAQMYGRSESITRTTKGIEGVPRGLPKDCYSSIWWNGLSQFEKDTVSQVDNFELADLAKKLGAHMSKSQPPPPNPTPGPRKQTQQRGVLRRPIDAPMNVD